VSEIVKPETARVLREEMGYENKGRSCRTCANRKSIDDPHLDRSWIEACALFERQLGLITIDLTGICKHWKESESPCA